MPRLEKEIMVRELRRSVDESAAILVTGYSGLASNEITELRESLRKAGGRLQVVKNRLARIVMQEERWSQLAEYVDGPTAFVLTGGDPVPVAKALAEFTKEHKQFQLRGGLVESVVVGGEQIVGLAMLPGREQLLAQLFGGLVSPISGFLNVISSPIGAFVRTLNAIREKVGGENHAEEGR
jgi:large subunit ribosomal protein L10